MIVDAENMGLDTLFVLLCAILAEIMVKNRFLNNGGTNLHIKLSQTRVNFFFIMVAYPHNMGL